MSEKIPAITARARYDADISVTCKARSLNGIKLLVDIELLYYGKQLYIGFV